jgi:glycosyltransferase involved in cell wall biosynthesis
MRALLSQDYLPLEVVVSDNASTDGTWEILERFREDPRVALHQSEDNVGAVANFNRVFHLTSGDYFAWAAADDRVDPLFSRLCVEALLKNPDAAGCLTGIRFVNKSGKTRQLWIPGAEATSHDLRTRLRWYLGLNRWTEIYALFRRPILEAGSLFPAAFGPDVLLVWEILLDHRMTVVAEPLFTYQEKEGNTIEAQNAMLVAAGKARRAHFCNLGMLRAMWIIAGGKGAPIRRVAHQELLFCLFRGAWRRRTIEDLDVELKWHRLLLREETKLRRVWLAKGRILGIHLVLAALTPRRFVRAAGRRVGRPSRLSTS